MTIKVGKEDKNAATMSAIKKAAESNQLRLQTLELAVAHLTNICIGLSEDVRSMRSILIESKAIREEGEEAVTEMKLPYYSNSNSSSLCSDSKDDLAIKKVGRQTWRKPLAQPQKKAGKASPAIKVQGSKTRPINVKAPMKPAPKGTSAAAIASHKVSTGSTKTVLIKKMAPAKTNASAVKSSAGRGVSKNSAGAAANMRANTAQAIAKVKLETSRISETATRGGLKKPANKADAQSEPVNVKIGGKESGSGGIAVKPPPHMADAPTIRSLIYGSRNVSVVKSRSEAVPISLKKCN